MEWQNAGWVPQGPRGDTIALEERRDGPNSKTELWAQSMRWSVEGGDYVPQGPAYLLGTVYDGWVHVGFYYPYSVQRAPDEVEFFRQWHCRESAESNTFNAEGPPESMGVVVLPQGPQGYPGGYYLITSDNPAPHVAYFYRQWHQWNEQAQEWEAGGPVEQIGGVVAPEGPQGPQGAKGDYYQLTADNPPDQPDTVRLYRQRHDGTTGYPAGQAEQIGQAIALQGPQGPPGPPGAPGAGGGWGYSDAWKSAGEFERLSFLARKLVEVYGAQVYELRDVISDTSTLAAGLLGVAGGVAAAVVATVATGGLALIVGTGVGLAGVVADGVIQAGLDAAVDPLATENVKDGAARALYCDLVPYRYFDDASINAFVAQYAGGDWGAQFMGGDYGGGLRTLVALSWQQKGPQGARRELGMILSQYYYNPAFDYTSLPCTPNLGTWQRVYDFTIDAQGWVLSPYGQNEGQYIAGEGWRGTYNSAVGQDTLHAKIVWPHEVHVTHVEMIGTDISFSGHPAAGWRVYLPPWEQKAGSVQSGELVTVAYTVDETAATLGASMVALNVNSGGLLRRVSITGDGTPPPEVGQ